MSVKQILHLQTKQFGFNILTGDLGLEKLETVQVQLESKHAPGPEPKII